MKIPSIEDIENKAKEEELERDLHQFKARIKSGELNTKTKKIKAYNIIVKKYE